MKAKRTYGDFIYDTITTIVLILILVLVAYPLYFVLTASISEPDQVRLGKTLLFPVGINYDGYIQIFKSTTIWRGYGNTILYTFAGTALNVALTILAGYALSRKHLKGRNLITGYFLFTMFFGGGLIPLYILVNNLGIYNTRWVMILLGAMGVQNMIICRTFFASTIPNELLESAFIDGAGHTRTFAQIVLPLSTAIIAVMTVFYMVGHWNAYFNALIYLSNSKLYPLQLVLRNILIENEQLQLTDVADAIERRKREQYADLIRYGLIVVSSAPMLMAYPFMQKYFVKGVMIGSLKG